MSRAYAIQNQIRKISLWREGSGWNKAGLAMVAVAQWELYCSRELAERLGAVSPVTIEHHRRLRDAGHLLVRDLATGWPMFWPWVAAESMTRTSS